MKNALHSSFFHYNSGGGERTIESLYLFGIES